MLEQKSAGNETFIMSEIITKAATGSKRQTEENRGFSEKKNAFRDHIYKLNKDATGNNYGVNIPQTFIKFTGSLDAAAFLAQMIHWTPRATRQDGFVFKKNAEWFEETGLKRVRIGTAAKALAAIGILEMKKLMAYGSPTWHYRLDTAAFENSFHEFLESGAARATKQKGLGLRKTTGVDAESETQLENDIETEEVAIAVRGVSDIEAALRTLIQNIPPKKTEEDALARLCGFVENGTYTPDDIAGCAKWILKTFDMIAVKPTSIEDKLPTYLAKKIFGSS